MRSRATAALLVGAALISGCGAASEESTKEFKGTEAEVAAVIEELVDASAKRDTEKICKNLLSPGSVAAILKERNQQCVDALPDLLRATTTREINVEKVTVDGDRATVAVAIPVGEDDQRAEMKLRKFGSGWRIVLIGDE